MRLENSTWHRTFSFPYFLQPNHPNSLQVCSTPANHLLKYIFGDLYDAQAAVQGGHVSCEKTAKKYNYWMSFCTEMQMGHMLEDPEDPVIKVL